MMPPIHSGVRMSPAPRNAAAHIRKIPWNGSDSITTCRKRAPMSAISPLTWNNPISGRAKMITGIAMIVETNTPKTTDCLSTSSALSRSFAPI